MEVAEVGGLGAALVTVPLVGLALLTVPTLLLVDLDELELVVALAGLDDELEAFVLDPGGGMTLKLDLAPHCSRDWPLGQHFFSVQ